MIAALVSFVSGGLGRLVVGGLIVGGLIGIWQLDRASQRRIGALQERIETERRNDEAVKEADAIGARSRDPLAGGVRDPYAGPDVDAQVQ